MKIPPAQVDRFLQTPDPAVRAILIYGPDAGLVSERAELLASRLVPDKKDPFAVSLLTGASLKDQSALLFDEACSLALSGGRRLVRLQQAIEVNTTALSAFLHDPPPSDSVVLIEAGDLEKRSKLRALCEGTTSHVVAIPCYVEDESARARTISDVLRGAKLQAAPEVVRYLAAVLPPDRLAMRQELDKLLLYTEGKKIVGVEDIGAVISDAGGAEVDDLVQAVASGHKQQAARLLDRLFEEQVSPIALLRAVQRHLMRLQLARAHHDNGLSAEAAIKKLSPPVFWKQVAPMSAQIQRWTKDRLVLRLNQLTEAEAAMKRSGTPEEALCRQLILHITARA